MALSEKSRVYSPVALGAASQAFIFGDSAPDGSIAPQSDAKKGSVYFRDDMTTDQSGMYLKVDTANADDDWVRTVVDKDEGTFTMEGNWTWNTSSKIYFRDTGLYIYSPADGDLQATVDGQFLVSGGSGVRLEGTALCYEYITLTPHQFNVASSASVYSGSIRNTKTGCYPAISYAGAGNLAAYSDYQKVPANAASSGSVRADVLWSASTDGDAAVFRLGYDYVASGEGPGTTAGSVILAGSCVSASALTATSIGEFPSFTAGEFFAVRVEHDGTSASDDAGSTVDVAAVTLRYVVDRLGEKT